MRQPYYKFFPSDYRAKTLDLTIEQHGVYRLLLDLAWLQPDGTLPADLGFIRRALPSMHGHQFTRLVPPILERFFVKSGDRFVNERLSNERQNADKTSEKQRQNVAKRWSRVKEINDLADTNVYTKTIPPESIVYKKSLRGGESLPPKKEEDPLRGTTVVPFRDGQQYAFEAGVIRLTSRDLKQWEAAFSEISVQAELLAAAEWAAEQKNWWMAVKGLLKKKNQEAYAKKTAGPIRQKIPDNKLWDPAF